MPPFLFGGNRVLEWDVVTKISILHRIDEPSSLVKNSTLAAGTLNLNNDCKAFKCCSRYNGHYIFRYVIQIQEVLKEYG